MLKTAIFATLAMFCLAHSGRSQAIPQGYDLPEKTLSPDQRYGVLVPQEGKAGDSSKNKLVEVRSGHVLGEIVGATGWDGRNHVSVLPARWSKNGGAVLWQVDGKWGPISVVLVRIENGAIQGQTDLYREVVQAILSRTKATRAKEDAEVKGRSSNFGSAYPDGFTIDIYAAGEEGDPLTFPLKIHADLTSDPKGISDKPLASYLDGTVDKAGKFTVTDFQLGAAADLRRW